MAKKTSKKITRALPAIFLTMFLDVLGVAILIPVIPQLLANPMAPDYLLPAGWSLNNGYILLAWLLGIYPFMMFLSTPILGQLSDRFGRKKVLAISLSGTALGYILFAIGILTKNIPLLFFSRALDGITGGNQSVAQAVIADVTPPKERTKMFGLIGATFGIGFVLGPYIGARLASPGLDFYGLFHTPGWFGATTPFWFMAGLSLINVLLILFLLPETHKHINNKLKLKLSESLSNIVKAATHPGLRVVFPSIFLYFGGFTFFTTFFQVFLISKLGFSQSNVGDYFAFVGIWIAIAQAAVTPFIAKRLANHNVLRFSLAMTGVALLGLFSADNTTQLLMVTPFFAIFNGLTWANATALVSRSAGAEVQGEVLGINASVNSLAQSIPAVISGYVAASIGANTPIVVGSLLMVAAGLLFWVLYHPSRHLVHAEG